MSSSTDCCLCTNKGQLKYKDLTDRLLGTQGRWNLMQCTNPACELIWLDPMPNQRMLELAYKEYYTHEIPKKPSLIRNLYEQCKTGYLVTNFGYPKINSSFFTRAAGCILAILPHRRAALDASILWLPWKSEGKILEIGCGNGDRLALLKKLGWQTLGIEPDAKSTEIARARGLEIINQPFKVGLVPENSIDAILLCHVIEHLPDPIETLKECYRILRPGGSLILLTPNTRSLGHNKFTKHWLHLDPPRHLYLFNSDCIQAMMKLAGFEKISTKTSIRDANWTLGGSQALKSRNEYQIGKLPLAERIAGLGMLYQEWLFMKSNTFLGEDLFCMGSKLI